MEERGNQSIIQFLIDNGADVNAKTRHGLTPLHCAVIHRNHCVIDILIQAGADINSKSCLKRTALHFAVSNYQPRQWKRSLPSPGDSFDMLMINKLLNQQNIDINVKDTRGDTPLMWAVMEKQSDIVIALLRKGANPNIRNKDSLTPLLVSLSAKDPCPYTVVSLLLHQASLNFEDKNGKTAIDILIETVRNTQSYDFAYTCLETIAFTHSNMKSLKQKLGSIPKLLTFIEDCCGEVMLMKLDVVMNDLSVFSFMLLGTEDFKFQNPLMQVYLPIVERLLAGIYPKYLYYILERIPKSSLSLILQITMSIKDSKEIFIIDNCEETSDNLRCEEASDNLRCEEASDNLRCEEASDNLRCEEASDNLRCEEAARYFFSKMNIIILSKYLSHLDVFCLIVAFSKRRIPECLHHLRDRKYK